MNGDEVDIHLELDCRLMLCPLPVIELAKAFPGVPVGAVVAVVTQDVAARTDVPAWCRMRGQSYLGEDAAADGMPRHLVRRLS